MSAVTTSAPSLAKFFALVPFPSLVSTRAAKPPFGSLRIARTKPPPCAPVAPTTAITFLPIIVTFFLALGDFTDGMGMPPSTHVMSVVSEAPRGIERSTHLLTKVGLSFRTLSRPWSAGRKCAHDGAQYAHVDGRSAVVSIRWRGNPAAVILTGMPIADRRVMGSFPADARV